MTYLIFETTLPPRFLYFHLRNTLQICKYEDLMKKKLTNDYESPKLETCAWNSLSELRPLYSLKSNPPSCTKFPIKNQNYFINLRDWQIKFTLKR